MTNDPAGTAARKRVSWRDTFDVWPYLSITVKLMPWHWRWNIGGERDYWIACLGPLQIDYGHNKGVFPLERVDV